MEDNREKVPCEVCSVPTPMTSTKLCDRCWELKTRIINSPEQAVKILVGLSTDTVKAVDMFGNDLTTADSFGTPVDADKVVVVLTRELAQALEWAVAEGIETLEATYLSHRDGVQFGQDIETAKDAHAMLQKALKDASHA